MTRFLFATASLLALAGFLVLPHLSAADPAANPQAQWIWLGGNEDGAKSFLRKSFDFDGQLKSAAVAATADNHFTLFLNGEKVLAGDDWNQLETVDVSKKLKTGKNVLAVEGENDGGIAAVLLQLRIVTADGKSLNLATDGSWKASAAPADKWQAADFDDSQWAAPKVVGPIGAENLPWTSAVNPQTLAVALGAPAPAQPNAESGEFIPVAATNVTPREGFKVEKIFQVPKSMGSWVSLTTDDKGRLYATDQGGAGLFRITPGSGEKPTKVEKMPVKFSGAHGMVWDRGALYGMVNGGASGLHRLSDSDGDDLLDKDEHVMPFPGGGEHGPHAVIVAPDGKDLYICAGNHTPMPKDITGSRIPQNWSEDHLLPRRWDANGHAAGILAPGGWIMKVDREGKQREIISMGYRNQYDIAFNADDELFSYDADMEWDLGSPWYRPTRVCHATSGSEFGWRSGTGKWPTYYEDSLPPVIDIGPGSPVGIVFGYGAKFPAKYQKALFLLDWTYSTIYAIHMEPDGATYKAVKEDFVFGSPMQVTDAIVGTDGALYFAIGGRGTNSALYRVTYTGSESTAPVDAKTEDPSGLRKLRHELETFHGQENGDLEKIFANLGHQDRFIRYAARIALESQPLDSWKEKALAVKEPRAALIALMAVARQGKPEDRDALLTALGRLDFKSLPKQDQLALLRTYELTFTRLGGPSDDWRAKLVEKLDPLYPASYDDANKELVQLLVYLRAPNVVSKTLQLMDSLGAEPIPDWSELAKRSAGYGGTVKAILDNPPPIRGIHYAFALRNSTEPWPTDLRKKYFEFFIKASKFPGGASFPGFLSQMREDALLNMPPAERPLIDDVASVSLLNQFTATPPKGPGKKWTKEEVLAAIGDKDKLRGCNYDQGRNLFHATLCAKCHRYNAEGGAVGPDLSTAGKKFNLPDLVDALVDPSKAISDQYGSHQVLTAGGDSLVGRVVEINGQVYVYTADANAAPKVFKKADIEEMRPSKVSQMPEGLLNVLNEQEVRNLVAYILAGGNKGAEYFKK